MDAEQAAEVERLRKHKHEIMQGTIVDCQRVNCDGVEEAVDIVADLYLAEHPADDGEPLQLEWVRSVCLSLPVNPSEDDVQWHWLPNSRVFLRWNDYGEDGKSGHGHWSANTSGSDPESWIDIGIVKTRGDVRRLCRALGIELKPV